MAVAPLDLIILFAPICLSGHPVCLSRTRPSSLYMTLGICTILASEFWNLTVGFMEVTSSVADPDPGLFGQPDPEKNRIRKEQNIDQNHQKIIP